MTQDSRASQVESAPYLKKGEAGTGLPAWLKVGAIAAASALAGGLAAAWYYRTTLDTLRKAELDGGNPEFGIPDSETEYDI
jgi:hypothetical protein